uniref:hypothetical protein n=1 Tax=uncultured Ruminococcus sp. TaxID=165186 RepID=UPI0025FE2FAE|nr:hypothetical protein [uncultured Ruminococcus sp.]
MFTLYSADVIGNPGNCSYPHKQVILDEDSLKSAISHDYVCAEYKNSYRSGNNFIGSDCLLTATTTIPKIQRIGLHLRMLCRHFQM